MKGDKIPFNAEFYSIVMVGGFCSYRDGLDQNKLYTLQCLLEAFGKVCKFMSNELSIINKIKSIVVDIDPDKIVSDAKSIGFNVCNPADFSKQAENYAYIEILSKKYCISATYFCAVGGLTSGVGGVPTMIALGTADIVNMAAQLYRLNQKLALINGFDPSSELHTERAQAIYLTALGIDATAQSGIRATVAAAAKENLLKRGPASSPVIRLIMEVVKILGGRITKVQAAKLVPVLGGVIGGSVNYVFAKSMAEKMLSDYKSDYFDRWQIQARDKNQF